jgi:hypothetical protein
MDELKLEEKQIIFLFSVTCYFEKKRAFATGIAVCGSGIFILFILFIHNLFY